MNEAPFLISPSKPNPFLSSLKVPKGTFPIHLLIYEKEKRFLLIDIQVTELVKCLDRYSLVA
ncbi:hypothetical protein CHL78_012110 [Romboutsia weinsteinii]|uniref:Uncharacterized protein n=1 Tax=Romboutsia weinsteinii TaxID=2020949 RepID=A0A371J2B0_9FIRM|nr:hypothetical protein [Romboutsia weinsteinii]RDY26808.1 hypothetical protein CHL78_012110 [Romboutsia weinsteinii]